MHFVQKNKKYFFLLLLFVVGVALTRLLLLNRQLRTEYEQTAQSLRKTSITSTQPTADDFPKRVDNGAYVLRLDQPVIFSELDGQDILVYTGDGVSDHQVTHVLRVPETFVVFGTTFSPSYDYLVVKARKKDNAYQTATYFISSYDQSITKFRDTTPEITWVDDNTFFIKNIPNATSSPKTIELFSTDSFELLEIFDNAIDYHQNGSYLVSEPLYENNSPTVTSQNFFLVTADGEQITLCESCNYPDAAFSESGSKILFRDGSTEDYLITVTEESDGTVSISERVLSTESNSRDGGGSEGTSWLFDEAYNAPCSDQVVFINQSQIDPLPSRGGGGGHFCLGSGTIGTSRNQEFGFYKQVNENSTRLIFYDGSLNSSRTIDQANSFSQQTPGYSIENVRFEEDTLIYHRLMESTVWNHRYQVDVMSFDPETNEVYLLFSIVKNDF